MFDNGNRIRFERAVDESGRNWWIERFFQPFGLTPEGMGDLVTQSAPSEKSIIYHYIDGIGEKFALRVEGRFFDAASVWFVEHTLELQGRLFNADEMFVPEAEAGVGRGRLLMKDLIDAARRIGIEHIKIQAQNIGRYAWLRMGFVPDEGSWRSIQADATRLIQLYKGRLGERLVTDLTGRILTGRPETAVLLAGMSQSVPSRELFDNEGRPLDVPLGRAIFLEGCGNWTGEFDLNDPDALKVVDDYVKFSR
jgi:GNAT superfamily N-acetyltransferase